MGPGDLAEVLAQANLQTPHPQLLIGPETLDDAGVFQLTPELALVQTVDFFTPIVDDPYDFGRIAAANALSDIYAMGGEPLTALNLVGFPLGKLPADVLARILQGGADKLREAGAVLLGGHSIDDPEPKYGLAVTGWVHPRQVWTNAGALPGDALVLTKPIGMGVVTTAIKRGWAQAEDVALVTAVMAELNKTAAALARRYAVHACTDITGYGLLGHAWEMASASGVRIHLEASRVPLLPSALAFAQAGAVPGGTRRNEAHVQPHVAFAAEVCAGMRTLLADAVTSGGLLLALPAEQAQALAADLQRSGQTWTRVIGRVEAGQPGLVVAV